MQISEVLAIHNSYKANQSHKDILGDPLLMQDNPIYRNIKLFALKIGCKYSEAWMQYLALPFHELNKIVETKNIPYVPNARMLQELENKRAGIFTTETMHMPESYHMHEAAHVVAEHLFTDVQLRTDQEKILKTILCESFANTIDALAWLAAEEDIHQYFLRHNCYMKADKEDVLAMRRLSKSLGFRELFKLTLLAYVHSNFLQESFWPEKEFKGQDLEDIETLVQMSEKLDPLFRMQTTEMYLRFEGYDGDVLDILNFQFMPLFKHNKDFDRVTEAMVDLL